jgi:HK97 family phage major capsid protein
MRSTEPLGVMTAVTGSGTIATGGFTTDPTFEKMVDLMVSVPNQYRQRNSCAWLTHDLTAGVLRKLRDGAGGTVGAFVWQPSQTVGLSGGAPETIFNFPVEVDSTAHHLRQPQR